MKYYVARDSDKELYLYCKTKPTRGVWDGWWFTVETSIQLKKTLFPKLKWADEPIEVKIFIDKVVKE